MGCANSHATNAISSALQRADDNVEPSTDAMYDDKLEETGTANVDKLPVDETVSRPNTIADDPKGDAGDMEDTSETAATISDLHSPNAVTNYNSVVSCEDRDDNASQEQFEHAVRSACLLLRPAALLECANSNVYQLVLHRSLPHHIRLRDLLGKLSNLQEIDVSGNQMGPQAFRTIMLALCHNPTIRTLKIADNQTDTDSAESVGRMLGTNNTLVCLDVSGNHLGADYFSRCVGPALNSNTSLSILRCEGIGSRDFDVLMNHLRENATLVELNLSNNGLAQSHNFIGLLAAWLGNSGCHLRILEVRSMELKESDLATLGQALPSNRSLTHLDVSGNQVAYISELLQFLMTCISHVTLTRLVCDNIKAETGDAWLPGDDTSKRDTVSSLQSLIVSNCHLEDKHISSLRSYLGATAMPRLAELVLTDNPNLTCSALKDFVTMSAGCVEKLTVALNPVDDLLSVLTPPTLSNLRYLNLRKARMSVTTVARLAPCVGTGGIETLVLDGIKLGGSDALKSILGSDCGLVALSLAGCQLSDDDITPVNEAIRRGLPLHMLKLATNRVTDADVTQLVDALMTHRTHPLALIDLMNNNISSVGAKKLSELFKSKKHESRIHSLNLNNNVIDCGGVEALVATTGKTSLTSLEITNQQVTYEEEDMNAVIVTLAETLGEYIAHKITQSWTVKEENGQIILGCSDLPSLPPRLTMHLQGLGGLPGELGHCLDSTSITTDSTLTRLPSITLQDALELAAFLKGQDFAECLLSSEEWNMIIGAKKDAPSWLQVASQRVLALYLCHLPASVTTQKMDGLLEDEADCSVKEVCLMKDLLTRRNNGLCWVLLKDAESINKATRFMNDGLAQLFSQPFLISSMKVKIDDAASSESEGKARHDMEVRMMERRKKETAHQILIQESYVESQERHAYRLAHPAYADGRIW